jgi:hypothetical protein
MTGPGEAVVVRLPERFEAFYEREYHRVVGFAYALTGSWEAAEDATTSQAPGCDGWPRTWPSPPFGAGWPRPRPCSA